VDKVSNKTVSVHFRHALFSLFTYYNMAMQVMVWLCMVQFGTVWFGVSHADLG